MGYEVGFANPEDGTSSRILDYRSEAAERHADVLAVKFDLYFVKTSLEVLIDSIQSGQSESGRNDPAVSLSTRIERVFKSDVIWGERCVLSEPPALTPLHGVRVCGVSNSITHKVEGEDRDDHEQSG